MRRWNGWGAETVVTELAPSAAGLLGKLLGPGAPPADVDFADVVDQVPPTRLAEHPLVATDPADRVRHARGQSLPDLIALRTGRGLVFPDGVAFAESASDVAEILALARRTGAAVIPYGGGTSVVGHVNVIATDRPVITLDVSRIAALESLDASCNQATFGAGISGRQLDRSLRPHGLMLGHFPQSYELSTLGGWIATRSRGQQALHYGGIDTLLAGAEIQTPRGPLSLPSHPMSSAGPDLRNVLLGSEGRLGVITSATIRVSPLPEFETFQAIYFADWDSAVAAVRSAAVARFGGLSMLRLADPTETALNLAMAGDAQAAATTSALRDHGLGEGACQLVVAVTGDGRAAATFDDFVAAAADRGGVTVPGETGGARWAAGRFHGPYLRNSLWEQGYAVDTVETSTTWGRVTRTREAVEHALRTGLAEIGERVFPFTHLSHVYLDGSSVYTTFLFRLAENPADTLVRWQTLKEAASRAILDQGATISHQHGVGVDHLPYLEEEKGTLGVGLLRSMAAELDPGGILNPGKLVE